MGGVALVARGIWWRRGASLVLVLCAALTVAGAAAGPVWGRAAQASLLARTLQDADVSQIAWTVTGATDSYGGITYPPPAGRTVAGDVERLGVLPPDLDALFDEPTETVTTSRRLQFLAVKPKEPAQPFAKSPLGLLVAKVGACGHVQLVSGRCPSRRTDVLISDRSARELQVGAGEDLRIPELTDERSFPGEPDTLVYRVAGVYRAETVDTGDRFWFDSEDFSFAPATTLGSETLPARLDAVLVQPDFALSLAAVGTNVQLERVLRPGAVTLADADQVARHLQEHATELAATSRIVDGAATAAGTISATVDGRQLVRNTATFVGLQVVVFGWVVLFGLVATTVLARDPELALAKLRGLRGRRLAVHALAEPVVLVLAAVPLGILGAWLAVAATARRVLLPGTPVPLPDDLWWAVGATAAGSVLACVLAAVRSLRMPVADQLRRSTSRSGTTGGPTVVAVLITLAVVGLGLVRTLGRGAQAALPALLTPVVVGLAAGLVVGAAVQVLMRALAARTHRWSLGPYLAVRQLARQSSLTRTTALVTVATAVSGFAAGAYVVTATQRGAQARLDVGAERVVHVAPLRTTDLLAATRQADPQGRWAMAAVQRGEGASALLAVDSTRFGVAFPVPRGALDAGGLNQLVPKGVPQPLAVRGNTAKLRVSSSSIISDDVEVGVQLRVVTPAGVLQSRSLGALGGLGRRPATLRATVPACAKGCTVVGVYLTRTGIGSITGTVDLASLEIGGRTYPFTVAEWRSARIDESVPDSASASSVTGVEGPAGGVTISFDASPSVTPGMVRRDVPTELPAILADGTQLGLLGARQLVGGITLEGSELPYAITGRTPAIPRSGQGSMVDLDLVSRVEPPRSPGLDFQVWLGTRAPADAVRRLRSAGLTVGEVESRAQRQTELDHAEPARAQLLLLGAGGAVLLAGVAGIATVLAAAARRRAVESAALHAMAVPGRTVRGSAVLEDVMLLLPGVIAGAVCASSLIVALTPVLAEVTGAGVVVSGPPATIDVVLPVLAAAVVTGLLLVPVVLAVTRPAADETPLRVTT